MLVFVKLVLHRCVVLVVIPVFCKIRNCSAFMILIDEALELAEVAFLAFHEIVTMCNALDALAAASCIHPSSHQLNEKITFLF